MKDSWGTLRSQKAKELSPISLQMKAKDGLAAGETGVRHEPDSRWLGTYLGQGRERESQFCPGGLRSRVAVGA